MRYQQYGTATPTIPQNMDGSTAAKTVVSWSRGDNHACWVRADKHTCCWGQSSMQQTMKYYHSKYSICTTDSGISSNKISPTQTDGTYAVQVSCGTTFCCARRNDTKIVCWGDKADGRLGHHTSSQTGRQAPILISSADSSLPENSGFTDLQCQDKGCCALRDTKKLYCWGENNYYQFGYPSGFWYAPKQVPNANNIQKIHAGECRDVRSIYRWEH
jgi:hypothetical protein